MKSIGQYGSDAMTVAKVVVPPAAGFLAGRRGGEAISQYAQKRIKACQHVQDGWEPSSTLTVFVEEKSSGSAVAGQGARKEKLPGAAPVQGEGADKEDSGPVLTVKGEGADRYKVGTVKINGVSDVPVLIEKDGEHFVVAGGKKIVTSREGRPIIVEKTMKTPPGAVARFMATHPTFMGWTGGLTGALTTFEFMRKVTKA